MRRRHVALVGSTLLVLAAPAVAQHETHATNARADTGIALFNNLGPHSRKITTRAPRAQQYFDQGMRLVYAFAVDEGLRSFEAAIRQDSACAMCYWGAAWALGPYVNGRMDSLGGVHAYAHIQNAKRLARNTSDVERALIDAMAQRYAATPTRQNRAPLDTAYMNAMRALAQRFSDDLDVGTLFGESIMVLRPWDYWTRAGGAQPGIDELLRALEGVLSRRLTHPGACHLYIHAVEASREPQRAEKCGDLLVDGMPGVSHMRHMPSHIYLRIGRYGDGVRANQLARNADQQAEYGGATAIYPSHNLHMLLSAAAYDGQSAVAIQAARDLARLTPGSAFQLPLVLVRFGRWTELLELPPPTAPHGLAIWNYARGVAQLRSNQTPAARASLAALEALQPAVTNAHQRHLLALARASLSAEIDAAARRYDDAIRTLERARVIETDSLEYDEPEDWVVPLRQLLGAILLDAGRPADAEVAYRGELEAHPENGWSLLGLTRALQEQGKLDDANQVRERFRRAWARADVDLRASRF